MKVLVNGDWREIRAAQLAALLSELGYGESIVTTALNGEFVATTVRAATALTDGDRIEVLAPMQGG